MSRLYGFLTLLCVVALLSSVSAEELSPAEAIVEARTNDAPAELPQPEGDKVLVDSLPAKSDLSESPAIIPIEVDEKNDEEQSLPVGEESMVKEENVAVDAEDSKKESLELAMNAEILKQPEMARLARRMRSFHNYQVYLAQKANGVRRATNDIDGDMAEDDGVVPEERAIRRRKRVYKRKANNNVRRVHRRKHVANRQNSAHRQNQRLQSVRRPNSKNSAAKRRRTNNDSNDRRSSSDKKQRKTTRSGSKRRSTSKNSSRKTKRKSSLKKRSNNNDNNRSRKHAAYEEDEEPAQIQAVSAPQMIVIVDGDKAETAYVAQAA